MPSPAPSSCPCRAADGAGIVTGPDPEYHEGQIRARTTDFGGDGMWSGTHDGSLEATARAIAEELRRNRSRQRAKAAEFSREQVERSHQLAHEAEAAELERLAVLGQIPQAEYKARMATLEDLGSLPTTA